MYKVLIVDDEPQVIYGLRKQIDWEAFNMELVGTATNGEAALTMMEQHHVDLLIADVCMPEMDGLTMITRIKQKLPSLRCIIVSAFNEFDFVKRALQLGVENYLLKPINGNELQETLTKTLDNLALDKLAATSNSPDVWAFRTNILDRWVNGTIQDFELLERAELLHIELSAPEYRVVVIEFLQYEVTGDQIHASTLWMDRCRAVLLSAFMGECFLDASFRVVCIFRGGGLSSAELKLNALLLQISETAAASGIKVFASVGPVSYSSARVSESYSTALFYLNYRLIDSSATFVYGQPFSDPHQGVPSEQQTLVIRFNDTLKEGDFHQANLLARSYMNLCAGGSIPELKRKYLPLVLSLVRTIVESGRISASLSESITDQLSLYAKTESKEELENWFSVTTRTSMQVIHERRDSYHLLIYRTLEQLNQNYEKELSLKTLAAAYNISPAYLGQLFKEETGQYFHHYLMKIRLQASKELLLGTDLKIGEIIGRIGIPNQSYYNRVFKKTYGISPVEFRRHRLIH